MSRLMTMRPQHFSFDTYPGLDRELDAIYERNVAEGRAEAAVIATEGLEAVIQQTLEQRKPERANLTPSAEVWAADEVKAAVSKWGKYHSTLNLPNAQELASSPNFAPTIERLHSAKESLRSSNLRTPEQLNAGDTMHLVLVPWQEMLAYLPNFDKWVKEKRKLQGVASDNDFFNDHLIAAIKRDSPLYRDSSKHYEQLTPSRYLNQKIAQDGPWGVMLMQTSRAAGLVDYAGQSPDRMTGNGLKPFEVTGHNVDAMGIFEWIALTLQEDPQNLSNQDYSWLLANRMNVEGGACVPYGSWYGTRVGSDLNWAGDQFDLMRPRLAVS